MAKKIIMITGGQRSGKSMYAEQLTLQYSNEPIYLATAEARDDEFRHRIELHQERRGPNWKTIEEQLHPGLYSFKGKTVLLDCLTMFCTNYFFHCDENVDLALACVKQELENMFEQDATFIIVTNEIGMAGVSDNKMMRQFTDLLGLANKHLAQKADKVILMISGIPITIK